jgi:hypothetical protein
VVCFSGDSQVQLFNGTWKIIGELQPGDHVYAYNGSKLVSAELIMMLDRHSFKNGKEMNRIYPLSLISNLFLAIFHTFKTVSGHEISLTALHLIAVVSFNGVLIYKLAKDVQIGDQLFVLSNQDLVPSSIVEMTINVKRGYYAPLTTEGSIE